jgi:hypothetical protein
LAAAALNNANIHTEDWLQLARDMADAALAAPRNTNAALVQAN